MYKYDQYDQAMVDARVEEFRDQVAPPHRRRADRGPVQAAAADERALPAAPRLYAARRDSLWHADRPQMRMLGDIADKYDRGYGHFTTRQNIQYNWIKLDRRADMLADLAKVEMHAIQTSGNCIRNISSDQYAGAAADEVVDPRPYAELLRQWSSFHPEFTILPRKFKIAVIASETDRAAMRLHDIGIRMRQERRGRNRRRVLCRRRHGPHPDDRAADPRLRAARSADHLFRGLPARLQPLRPPRQQVQGADQDPRPRTGQGRIYPPGRGRIRAPADAGHRTAAGRTGADQGLFRRPGV